MKKPSEEREYWLAQQEKIIGLGERSLRKTYYPQLQQRLNELEKAEEALKKANEELERRRTAELENSRAELEAQNENLVKYWMTWKRRPLLNILINARDAFLERRTENALIKVRSFPEKDRAVVTIADNTGGIGEEIIDKIFDVYFTTKELGKGSGCSWRK